MQQQQTTFSHTNNNNKKVIANSNINNNNNNTSSTNNNSTSSNSNSSSTKREGLSFTNTIFAEFIDYASIEANNNNSSSSSSTDLNNGDFDHNNNNNSVVAAVVPRDHVTTVPSSSSIDPEQVKFFTRNATFIEYNNGKLLLSSVKHGVTLEVPQTDDFDEMTSRVRLVDALTHREVFCSTSSSLRSKGQRVVYGQTLSLFDQCSNDHMSTELEFRFRESTTTNKRPYVLRIEICKASDIIGAFQTEPFNVVWRDPAKTSRKSRGSTSTIGVSSNAGAATSPASSPKGDNSSRPTKKRKLSQAEDKLSKSDDDSSVDYKQYIYKQLIQNDDQIRSQSELKHR